MIRGFHGWQLDANSGPTRWPTRRPTRVREFQVGTELGSSLGDKSLQLAESGSRARFQSQLQTFQLDLPTRILNSTSFLSCRCTESFRVLFFPPPSHPRTTSSPSTNSLSQRPLEPGDKCTLVLTNDCNLAYPGTHRAYGQRMGPRNRRRLEIAG